MATQNFTNVDNELFIDEFFNAVADIAAGNIGSGPNEVFIMRAIDTGAPVYPTYYYWAVSNNPDSTGTQATPPNGGPLTNIVVFRVIIS